MSYTRFESDDIVLSSEAVSTPIWTGNVETITKGELASNSAQTTGLSGDFYMDLYKTGSNDVQFAIAYGDVDGSGSRCYDTAIPNNSRSRTTYGQYRSLVLGDEESSFEFNPGTSSLGFFVMSVDRARYKESLRPGSLELTLTTATGSNPISFYDEGRLSSGSVKYIDSGRVYNLYTGSAGSVDSSKSYGYFLPDVGTLLLDVKGLSDLGIVNLADIRWNSTTAASSSTSTFQKLFDRFSNCSLKAQETVSSNYIFVRAKNSQFNYSINPTNITETGELRHDCMINSPETYITSVGLYNDNNDLLAVAKLSRPLPKSFSKEALIRIKLNY